MKVRCNQRADLRYGDMTAVPYVKMHSVETGLKAWAEPLPDATIYLQHLLLHLP